MRRGRLSAALAIALVGCAYDWSTAQTQQFDSAATADGSLDAGADPLDALDDPCAACGPHSQCQVSAEGITCTCEPGYLQEDSQCIPDVACSALGCDPHAACVVDGEERSCECLAGYSGDGHSCADLDECEIDNGGCPGEATCSNMEGSRTCSCNPGFEDTHGDGSACADKCSLAGCDLNASCSVVGTEAVCTCTSPYVGDGKTCTFDECPPGFTGSRCETNRDDCAPNPCQNSGTCVDGVKGYTCTCSSAFMGANCELERCGDTSLHSRTDVENNRLCAEIQGTLHISGSGIAQITANDFPHLTRITGSLEVRGLHTGSVNDLQTVTLSSLQVIGGGIFISGIGGRGPLKELHLPTLTTVGDGTTDRGIGVFEAGINYLDLPALTTINGPLFIYSAPKLCAVNLRRINRVMGAVSLTHVLNVSQTAFEALRNAATGAVTQSLVGCCLQPTIDVVACTDFAQPELCGC